MLNENTIIFVIKLTFKLNNLYFYFKMVRSVLENYAYYVLLF